MYYCHVCGKEVKGHSFNRLRALRKGRNYTPACSLECDKKSKSVQKDFLVRCLSCNNEFLKNKYEIKQSPNHFCSHSCAATYHNTHKTYGTRRSKLEAYLEEQTRLNYPDLKLICNSVTAINSELDFYFPDLRLAIELNGIFHYEPIFGPDKLFKTQNNDKRKFAACHEAGVSLAIIDSSTCSYLNQKAKDKYWSIFNSLLLPFLEGTNG